MLPCRSLGFYAEDEADELHRRLCALTELMGVDTADLSAMAWRSAVADDADLVQPDERGTVRPTAYFHHLEQQALAYGARFVILDAVTNFYGADEVRRRQVNAFLRLLRQLVIQIDGPVESRRR
jgi:RecA-family ATPase